MTLSKTQKRFTDELLYRLVGDADPTELLNSGQLLGELKQKSVERILDAETDVH